MLQHEAYRIAKEPRQLASGFSYVAVNGILVLDEGRHTGATPGRALRHRRWLP
jgi:N-acyl-D-amino-acid deacylase